MVRKQTARVSEAACIQHSTAGQLSNHSVGCSPQGIADPSVTANRETTLEDNTSEQKLILQEN